LRHLPASMKVLAGFLFASYSRNKRLYILISYVFLALHILFLTSLYALDTNSGSFQIDLATFLNAGGAASSANAEIIFSGLGETVGSLQDFTSPQFGLTAGQIPLLIPLISAEMAKWISDLRARTDVLGYPISEATWQTDNDPYFSWEIEIEPPELLTGFSVSLDTQPDTTIDTTSAFYQFPEDSITSGKHTFYVLPFTTGGLAKEGSLLKFEFWVDVDMPLINQLSPYPGAFISDSYAPITCYLYDADAGLDKNLTTLSLNNRTVYFDYDAQNRLLKFQPESPLSEGNNTVLLKAQDLVGNYALGGWNFIVDTQGPSGSILLNNGEEFTHSAYVFLNIQTEDAVSGVKYIYISNDGIFDTEMNHPEPYSPVISNWLVAEPDRDGLKTVYVKFQDAAGNLSPVYKDELTLKLKTPDTRIISGPAVVTAESGAEFKYEASRPGCQFSYKLDNLDWSQWSAAAAASFTGLNEGNHYFYVKSAFDLNGDGKLTIDEEDATLAQWVWNIKTTGKIEELPRKTLFWRR